MFKFLKEKLKGALNTFSKEVEEETEVIEETPENIPEKEAVEEKVEEKTVEELEQEEEKETTEEEITQEPEEEPEQEKDIPEEVKASEDIPTPLIEEESKEEITQEQEETVPEKATQEEPIDEEPKEETPEKVVEEPVKEVEEETPQEETLSEQEPDNNSQNTEPVEEVKEKKSFFGKLFKKKEEVKEETPQEETVPEVKEEEEPIEEPDNNSQNTERKKKEGFFSKLTKITLSEEKFEDLFWELEIALLENNVAVEVIEKIKHDLKEVLTGEKVSRKSVDELIQETLKKTITEILSIEPINLLKKCEEKKPLIIAMIGVNGSGKTTSLAKLIKYFQDNNKTVVVAAADTFRAAAIQQVEEHTTKLGVKLIKHDYNADPAAVAFDAVKHATAKGLDVVLIDSAGRLHSNDNLMNELKKLIRINKPDLNIFVGEAITGNDCVEQATLFNEAVGIDGIILAKADVDEKGGAAISASYVTKKPVLFLGTGQNYEDLKPFNKELVLESLGL